MENITFNRASIQQQAAKGILPENTNTNFQSTMKAVSDQPMSQTAILASLEQMIKDLVAGLSEDKEKSSKQSTDDKAKGEAAAGKEGEAATNGGDIAIQAENGTDGAIGQQASFWQVGTNSDDTLNGRSQMTDYIWGGNGDDKIDGKSGNDYLVGGNGDDQIDGGSGNDYLWGQNGDDTLNGGSGNDYLNGGAGDDKLNGGSGNDVINAIGGDDTVKGGSGNDTIISGLRDASGEENVIDGGSGDDTVRYLGKMSDYNISPPPGFAGPDGEYTVTNLATGKSDTLKNIEFLKFSDTPAPINL